MDDKEEGVTGRIQNTNTTTKGTHRTRSRRAGAPSRPRGRRTMGGRGSPSRPDNEDLRDTETTKTEDLDQQHDKDDGGRRPDVVVFPVVRGDVIDLLRELRPPPPITGRAALLVVFLPPWFTRHRGRRTYTSPANRAPIR